MRDFKIQLISKKSAQRVSRTLGLHANKMKSPEFQKAVRSAAAELTRAANRISDACNRLNK